MLFVCVCLSVYLFFLSFLVPVSASKALNNWPWTDQHTTLPVLSWIESYKYPNSILTSKTTIESILMSRLPRLGQKPR